ncbi:MAG: hypothetical protein H6809_04895 [Phycisphaeraceae bacterium]|nr:hypothetical protein [Phycisphaeraceae bacterium]
MAKKAAARTRATGSKAKPAPRIDRTEADRELLASLPDIWKIDDPREACAAWDRCAQAILAGSDPRGPIGHRLAAYSGMVAASLSLRSIFVPTEERDALVGLPDALRNVPDDQWGIQSGNADTPGRHLLQPSAMHQIGHAWKAVNKVWSWAAERARQQEAMDRLLGQTETLRSHAGQSPALQSVYWSQIKRAVGEYLNDDGGAMDHANKERTLTRIREKAGIESPRDGAKAKTHPYFRGDVAKMATTASKSPNPKWQRVGGALNRFLAERMPD